MIVPQFLRFYGGYTIGAVLDEYAVVFFSLVNSMFRIQATESLARVQENAIPQMDQSDARRSIEELRKNARGISGIVNEVRTIK
ncbi:MAG: hypothetical protein DRR04_10400 [Gammaproteobacteria bacterium]|nr:MAG: hypothetical protein DRR04_10400 [Gammaproteobacteria bacterium]